MKKRNIFIKKLCMLVATLVLCASLTACDSSDYKKAEGLYTNGDYAAALELYNALGEYKDSQEKAKSCQYAIANGLFENMQYEEALAIFQELHEYEDSQEKVMACQYVIANDLFENAQYDDALAIYKELGEYENCAEQAAICEKEIGMTTNADYAFLAAIEESVQYRLNAADGTSYTELVNRELAYLDKFADESFYDDRLQEISSQYIEGLYVQREALDAEYEWEYQLGWQRGVVLRFGALTQLYEEYNFLENDAAFIAAYVMEYEDSKALLEAYEAIEADIHSQTSADDFPVDFDYAYDGMSGTVSFTIKNNTKYTYSTMFEFSFLSGDDTIFYSNSAYIENIKPGNSYVVSVYVDFTDCSTNEFFYNWNNYYTDVQY